MQGRFLSVFLIVKYLLNCLDICLLFWAIGKEYSVLLLRRHLKQVQNETDAW